MLAELLSVDLKKYWAFFIIFPENFPGSCDALNWAVWYFSFTYVWNMIMGCWSLLFRYAPAQKCVRNLKLDETDHFFYSFKLYIIFSSLLFWSSYLLNVSPYEWSVCFWHSLNSLVCYGLYVSIIVVDHHHKLLFLSWFILYLPFILFSSIFEVQFDHIN